MSDNPDLRPDGVPADQTPTTPQTPAPQAAAPAQPPVPPYPAPALPPRPAQPAPAQQYPAPQPSAGTPTAPYPGAGFGVAPDAQQTVPFPPHTTQPPRRKTSSGKIVGLLVAAALVGGAAGLGGTWAGLNLWSPAAASPAAGPAAVTVNNTASVNSTTAIAAKVVPSVVTVNVTGTNEAGTGSGVILNKQGDILTNTHVVTIDGDTAHANISVTTSDGHIYPATVVGTDPIYDLAVIRIKGAQNLTPITWGDSSKLNVGDQTAAVGAPLGLSNTVTTGIVSALNRSISIASSAAPKGDQSNGQQGQGDQGGQGSQIPPFFFDFGQGGGQQQQQQQQQSAQSTIDIAVIQTDAPINPGNSGGALVDSAGKLVGINVAIASTGGSSTSGSQSGSIGVGFSIPSDIAHRVADELMQNGTATHGLLGASVRDAAGVQGATITGAYIVDVTPGGGAARGGLKSGDVVTAFNDVPVGGAVDLTAQVRAAAAGTKATVTYVRDGQTHTADVTLGALK